MRKVGLIDSGNLLIEISPQEWADLQKQVSPVSFQEHSLQWHIRQMMNEGFLSATTGNAVLRNMCGLTRDNEYYPGLLENKSLGWFITFLKDRDTSALREIGAIRLAELRRVFLNNGRAAVSTEEVHSHAT